MTTNLELFLPGFVYREGTHWEDHLPTFVRYHAARLAAGQARVADVVPLEIEVLVGLVDKHLDRRKYPIVHSRAFCWAVGGRLSDRLGMPGGLKFKRLLNRHTYGYEADVIVASRPVGSARALVQLSAADGHEKLARAIRDFAKPHHGVPSRYSANHVEWLAKPLRDWDCNELSVLLGAFVELNIVGCSDDGEIDDWAYVAFEYSLRGGRLLIDVLKRLHGVKRNEDLMKLMKLRSKP
ncbi:hypothetical protein Rpal_1034 [Rhodopseudomonas palustris TIE-1]|uniref:hypothetical protein n=1 Tax=Rhodopseudomonas TaxID=1073 RepID=UPI000164BEA7|nr:MULTISPECIES: hypothetical protein [Rhodopseudomonas]ACE99590.1 hypothetical protein Rpal_1034 [Rhodopseudomonas palustris TIE-1]